MIKLPKTCFISASLALLLLNCAYGDSSNTQLRPGSSVVSASLVTEPVTITFTSNSDLSETQVLTCPSPTTNLTYSSEIMGFALTALPIQTVQTATTGGSYEDEHFNTVTTSNVPAYISCSYVIEYYKNGVITNSKLAAAQLLFGTSTVPSTAQTCPTSVFGSNAANFQCIIGWGSVLYNNAGAGTITPNTSICLDDSALQAGFKGGIVNSNSSSNGGNGTSFTVNTASGGIYSSLNDNSSPYNSLSPIPSCKSPLQIYMPPGTTYTYQAGYTVSLTAKVNSTTYTPEVMVIATGSNNNITITAGQRNTWTIGAPPNTFSKLCYNGSKCTWHSNSYVCMTNDCAPNYTNPGGSENPTNSVSLSPYP